jgi:hypothetical protein
VGKRIGRLGAAALARLRRLLAGGNQMGKEHG